MINGQKLKEIVVITAIAMSTKSQPDSENCVFDPSQPKCVNYHFRPNLMHKWLDSSCELYPNLVSCAYIQICKDNSNNSNICSNLTHIVNLCNDNPLLDSCKSYNQLCRATSIVNICKRKPLIPSTTITIERIHSLCKNSSNLKECNKCQEDEKDSVCEDPLKTLSSLCQLKQFTNLEECTFYRNICTDFLFEGICLIEPPLEIPKEKNYFSFQLPIFFLFEGWVIRNYFQIFVAMIFSFSFGLLFEIISFIKKKIIVSWIVVDKRNERGDGTGDLEEDPLLGGLQRRSRSIQNWLFGKIISVKRRTIRSSFKLLEVILMLLLLIVFLTKNVTLILSGALGVVAGHFFFGDTISELGSSADDY